MEENKRQGQVTLSFLKIVMRHGDPHQGPYRRAPTQADRRPKRPAGEKYSAKRGMGAMGGGLWEGGRVLGGGEGMGRGRVWEGEGMGIG